MNTRQFLQNTLTRAWLSGLSLVSMVLLSGCGALWDSAFPPADPRAKVTFHLASYQPQAGWDLHSGPLGNPQVYVQSVALMTAADVQKASALVDRSKSYYVGVEVSSAAATRLQLATARIATRGYALVILEDKQLISVMPLVAPMTGNQFAIPVKSAAAAQGLMEFLSPEPEGRKFR